MLPEQGSERLLGEPPSYTTTQQSSQGLADDPAALKRGRAGRNQQLSQLRMLRQTLLRYFKA